MKKSQFQKLLLIIFVLLLLLPGCQADDGMVTVYCLTGIQEFKKGGDVEAYPVTFVYDETGNLLQLQRDDFGCHGRWEYTYDSKSNLLRCNMFEDGILSYTTIYTYDAADQRISGQQYDSAMELVESKAFTYNDKGDKLSSLVVDEITKMRTLLHYFYDENGTCVSIQKGSFEGHMSAYVDWIYDENGRLLEERTAANDAADCVYTYNEKGWLTSLTVGNGFQGEFVFTHDKKGNIITVTFGRRTEEPYLKNLCSYDRKGRITEEIELKPDGTELHRNVYTYDRQGNMLSHNQTSSSFNITTEWAYDKAGRMLSQKTTTLYSYIPEAITTETTWLYDKSGNLIQLTRGNFSYQYSYTPHTLPEAIAKKIQQQQNELLEDLINFLPTPPPMPKVVSIQEDSIYLPQPEDIFPKMYINYWG